MDNQQELELPDREDPPAPAETTKRIPELSHHEEQIVRRSLGSVRMLGTENVEAALLEGHPFEGEQPFRLAVGTGH